jgi:hypothetical protein
MGLFTDLFSTKPAEQAAADKQAGLTTANNTSSADLTAGQAGADALYQGAGADYAGLAASAKGGVDAYGDASGANGADGLAKAGTAFKGVTGYQGGLDTGIDQVLRNNAKTGNLGGGNTSADEIKFASDYDDTHYKDYVAGLAPYLGINANAVAGEAGAKTTQAGADLGVAGTKATNDYNTATGIGNSKADADLAPYSASSNFWGALMGAGKLALGAATGGASTAAGSVANGAIKLGSAGGPSPFS